ncbi:hypothetical protein LK540_00665 [Massilia sp. IC2-278]|uniref:hypothetical protein n=1 Tax=Massilia sp. IC2-278 TaxID=2887200 RepID=UPI001E29127B|nr:hypothetical protein [Massilia sp. IC2-278]MCC2958946.1 hypothetical protein [Massilia sp. IC2-278]
MMKHMIGLAVVALALVGCGNKAPEIAADSGSNSGDNVARCTERGVAYFKEIGSYPTLTSAPNAGRAAEDVAMERCQRTLTAF